MLLILTVAAENDFSKVFVWIKEHYEITFIIGGAIVGLKALVDNIGNTRLEEKFRSNSTKLQDQLFFSTIVLVFYTLLIYVSLGQVDLLGPFIVSIVLVVSIWVISIAINFMFNRRHKFYIELSNVEWEFVRMNKKNGYLFKRKDAKDNKVKYYKFLQMGDFKEFICKENSSRTIFWFNKTISYFKSGWTIGDNEVLSQYIKRYRVLREAMSSLDAAGNEIVKIIRQNHSNSFTNGSKKSLKVRLERLEKVMAGDEDQIDRKDYDEPFFNKLRRE